MLLAVDSIGGRSQLGDSCGVYYPQTTSQVPQDPEGKYLLNQAETVFFYWLSLEITYCHFLCTLLVNWSTWEEILLHGKVSSNSDRFKKLHNSVL